MGMQEESKRAGGPMPTHPAHVVARDEAVDGRHGERLMASGRHVGLCLWERDPAGERRVAPDERNEHVAYVESGALIVTIADDPPVEVHAGDSYVVPVGARHRFEVLEPATVVEAVCPPSHMN
jgi:mannose-6-phosphate isomerase-like protein (cupin superfamily)